MDLSNGQVLPDSKVKNNLDTPEFLDSGLKSCTLDAGLWTLDPGRWTMDAKRQTLDVKTLKFKTVRSFGNNEIELNQ